MIKHFIEACLIGIAIAAPVGPIGMLCIRKTIDLGLKGSLAVGLGAALADSVYGLIAAMGISAISQFLMNQVHFIKLIGGLLLIYLAYNEFKQAHVSIKSAEVKEGRLALLTTNVFFLTLANPATILSFIAIFASIGGDSATVAELILLVFGVFVGSMIWWTFLGTLIVKIKHKLPQTWLDRIRYASAIMLGAFGVFALIAGIMDFYQRSS
jgi:putative LysE/RhtB family amino acid efflux pump